MTAVMSLRNRLVAVLTGAILLAAAMAAQAAPAQRTSDTWLEQYGQSIAGETAGLRAAGLGPDWDRIHSLVERYLQPQTYPASGSQKLLRAYHVASTANFLVRVGYRARHLAHPAQARILVRAANIVSWSDADALVLVSPVVFVAELVRIDRKPDNSAELVFRVREPIKSAPAKGAEFRYPLNGPYATVATKPGGPPTAPTAAQPGGMGAGKPRGRPVLPPRTGRAWQFLRSDAGGPRQGAPRLSQHHLGDDARVCPRRRPRPAVLAGLCPRGTGVQSAENVRSPAEQAQSINWG